MTTDTTKMKAAIIATPSQGGRAPYEHPRECTRRCTPKPAAENILDEAAADGELRGHAAAPGTGWARRNASSASTSPLLSCSGGNSWPIAASATANAARWTAPASSPAL